MGGYFNDDGINIIQDNPFHPMAEETKAILAMAEQIAPDFIVHMHGWAGVDGDHIVPAIHQNTRCHNICVDFC